MLINKHQTNSNKDIMITISIFIASSSEMRRERLELIDLLGDLNDEYEVSGIKFAPVVWEYMDSSMREGRKEDDYLRKMVRCQICIVMFWQNLGEYTLEEFEVAMKEMQDNKEIKSVFLLFKEPCEEISTELSQFKQICQTSYQDITYIFNSNANLRSVVENLLTH